jgi:hypothetical protein
LLQGQETTLGYVIVNEHIALHSKVADGRAAIDGLAIPGGIADFNIRSDFAAQGSDGAVADLDILELEELSLRPLETLSPFGGELDGFVTSTFFADVTTDLGQGEDEQNQTALQHNLYLGIITYHLNGSRSNVLTFSVLPS